MGLKASRKGGPESITAREDRREERIAKIYRYRGRRRAKSNKYLYEGGKGKTS